MLSIGLWPKVTLQEQPCEAVPDVFKTDKAESLMSSKGKPLQDTMTGHREPNRPIHCVHVGDIPRDMGERLADAGSGDRKLANVCTTFPGNASGGCRDRRTKPVCDTHSFSRNLLLLNGFYIG